MPVQYADAMAEQRDVTYFQLRVPPELHARVQAIAKREDRSVHWAYLRVIRAGLEVEERP